MRVLQAILMMFVFSMNNAQGATITSANSGNWSDPSTWDCACVPSAADNVVIGTHIITVNQDATITDLEVTIGGILTGNGKILVITGNLNIDGVIAGSLNVISSGTGNISGSGLVNTSGTVTFTGGDKTFSTGTSVDNPATTLSDFIIDAGVTITNNGFLIAGAKIYGNAASKQY